MGEAESRHRIGIGEARSTAKRRWLVHAVVTLLACAAAGYGSVVSFGFNYDDFWTVVDNRALEQSLAPLLRALFSGRAIAEHVPDATRPLMVVSMWADKRMFGAAPAGYHAHSLVLYAGCCVAACLATFAITRRLGAALWGGCLFAVFPVHAEVVAAVNYREDLYAALSVFVAVAWLFWPRARRDTIDNAVLVSFVLLAGLFAKESTVTIVPVALAAALMLGRGRGWIRARRRALIGVVAVVTVYVVYRLYLRRAGLDDVPLSLEHRGPVDRCLRTCRYLTRMTLDGLFPVSWAPDYAPDPPAPWWWALPPLGAVAWFGVVGLRGSRRLRVLAAGVAVALVAGLPTSPLVGPINETTDRYAFVGTLGGAIVWGALLHRATRSLAKPARIAALVLVVAPLALLSRRAAAPWVSEAELWRVAVERAPESPRAWAAWSRLLRISGDLDGADSAVERAILLRPAAIRPRVTRIFNLLARGKVDEAQARIEELRREGHGRAQGLRLATRCAELGQLAAPACVAQSDKRRPAGGLTEKALPRVPSDDTH